MHPFTDTRAASVAALGEVALLGRIREWLGDAAPPSPQGMGDDTAVLATAPNLLTADSLVHGRHFDDSATPAQAGAKLLKRNLSDIAAMGGEPLDAVVALFLPRETSLEWLEDFTRGLGDCACEYGVRIAGGDLTETPGFLGGTLTLTGRAARPLLRTGATEGAAIYVTGALGGSIEGHHFAFAPRLPEGRFLATQPAVQSCIDVTDGLAKDLAALLAPGLAAALDVAMLPASQAAQRLAGGDRAAQLRHILCDGEDYELAFSLAPAADSVAFEAAWRTQGLAPLTRIGTVVRAQGDAQIIDSADGLPLTTGSGYEHFR